MINFLGLSRRQGTSPVNASSDLEMKRLMKNKLDTPDTSPSISPRTSPSSSPRTSPSSSPRTSRSSPSSSSQSPSSTRSTSRGSVQGTLPVTLLSVFKPTAPSHKIVDPQKVFSEFTLKFLYDLYTFIVQHGKTLLDKLQVIPERKIQPDVFVRNILNNVRRQKTIEEKKYSELEEKKKMSDEATMFKAMLLYNRRHERKKSYIKEAIDLLEFNEKFLGQLIHQWEKLKKFGPFGTLKELCETYIYQAFLASKSLKKNTHDNPLVDLENANLTKHLNGILKGLKQVKTNEEVMSFLGKTLW